MISLSSTTLNFGNVNVGSTSSLVVIVTNDSSVPAKIDLVQGNNLLNPDTQGFSLSLMTFVVDRNSTYSFNVEYTPDSAVLNASIVQVFVDDAPSPLFTISLSGTGTAVPIINAPETVNFPKVFAKEANEETFTIQNNGSDTLVISSIFISSGSDDFSIVSFGPSSVLPGQSAAVTVRYVPDPNEIFLATGNRTRTGSISIVSNATSPLTTVNLLGTTGIRDGAWQTFQLSALVPSYLIDGAKQIESMVSIVKVALDLASTAAKAFKATLISLDNPLSIPLAGLKAFVDSQFDDLRKTGVYVLPIMPVSFYNDPKTDSSSQFSSMVASIGGGSSMFKQRIIDSFDDIYDGNRPQFSDFASVGAVIVAIDSGNFEDVVKGWRQIKGVFDNIEWKSEVIPPGQIKADGKSGQINVTWTLPDVFSYDLSFGLSGSNAGLSIGSIAQSGQLIKQKLKINPLDFIDKFEVYSSEIPNNLIVADQDIPDSENSSPGTPIKKGDVYRLVFTTDIPKKQKATPVDVNATDLLKNTGTLLASNFSSKLSDPVKSSIWYRYIDSGKTNGKTYYYSIRTVMKSGDTSRLSSEVFATPEVKVNTVSSNGLKKCANLKIEGFGNSRTVQVLPQPTVISVRQKKDSQISNFSFVIVKSGINTSTVNVCNFSKAMRMAMGIDLVDGSSRVMDVTGITIDNFDVIDSNDSADLAQRKKLFLNDYSSRTNLINGIEVKMRKTNDANRQSKEVLKIAIQDINGKGYAAGDQVVISYSAVLDTPIFRCSLDNANLDQAKCFDGTNNGICGEYSNKACVFHGGDRCLNVGNTRSSVGDRSFVDTPNVDLFKFGPCQDGTNRGVVNEIDKQFTNSANRSVMPVQGICAGYTAVDDVKNAVGQYPDWKKVNAGGISYMFPHIDAFVKLMQDFVDKQIGSIQSSNDTVTQFLDLLIQKTDSFKQTLDALDNIVQLINTNYTGAGFNVLNIAPATGGVRRIKQKLVEAQGGPDSGVNGFTAGIVILYGDDAITAHLISKLFGPSE